MDKAELARLKAAEISARLGLGGPAAASGGGNKRKVWFSFVVQVAHLVISGGGHASSNARWLEASKGGNSCARLS